MNGSISEKQIFQSHRMRESRTQNGGTSNLYQVHEAGHLPLKRQVSRAATKNKLKNKMFGHCLWTPPSLGGIG